MRTAVRHAQPARNFFTRQRLFINEVAMYDMKNLTKFKKLGELAPEAFKGFVAFDEAAFRDGAIPLKYREK
jgi:hypothetical protein